MNVQENLGTIKFTTLIKFYEIPFYFTFILPLIYYQFSYELPYILIVVLVINIMLYFLIKKPNMIDVLLMCKFVFVERALFYVIYTFRTDYITEKQKIVFKIIDSLLCISGFVSTIISYYDYHRNDIVKSLELTSKNKIIDIIFDTIALILLKGVML